MHAPDSIFFGLGSKKNGMGCYSDPSISSGKKLIQPMRLAKSKTVCLEKLMSALTDVVVFSRKSDDQATKFPAQMHLLRFE